VRRGQPSPFFLAVVLGVQACDEIGRLRDSLLE